MSKSLSNLLGNLHATPSRFVVRPHLLQTWIPASLLPTAILQVGSNKLAISLWKLADDFEKRCSSRICLHRNIRLIDNLIATQSMLLNSRVDSRGKADGPPKLAKLLVLALSLVEMEVVAAPVGELILNDPIDEGFVATAVVVVLAKLLEDVNENVLLKIFPVLAVEG